eukprot:37388-Pyramimonas_sp.AAC.1
MAGPRRWGRGLLARLCGPEILPCAPRHREQTLADKQLKLDLDATLANLPPRAPAKCTEVNPKELCKAWAP